MLSTLVSLSNQYGRDEQYVLAGGGNTSCKDDRWLFIKGSGTTLADITADGFVKMDRAALAAMWTSHYPEAQAAREQAVLADLMASRAEGEQHKRPSVETLLHDLFPQKYVVHTHPALVNGLTCSQNGPQETARLFGGRAVWLDAIEPGYVLAAAVRAAMQQYKSTAGQDADIILLGNHGVFIAGNTPEEIDATYAYVFDTLTAEIKATPDLSDAPFDRERAALLAPAVRMLTGGGIAAFHVNVSAACFLESAAAFTPIASVFSPDHMVYYKRAPLFIPHADDIEAQYTLLEQGVSDFQSQYGFTPGIVAVEQLGFYAIGASKRQADIKAALFNDTIKIATYAQSFGGGRFMGDALISFIENWEAESYRQSQLAGGGVGQRLLEKVIIVTGSAQGFGLGLAEHLLGEGANVVLSDLNATLAEQEAARLTAGHGAGRALALAVNVGDEDSVRDMVYNTALCYGGLDVFVSNAGVLKAGALEEMSVSDFEFVTKINYTAYFTCVKYASRIMKIQHRFAPEAMMDIVQINSKSGLSGSNKNFAYAGGKFGGLGLTQSFALELIPHQIKVNAICPGNLLSGPLWNDPDRGLFVQYLRAGKVPGAKTIEDVRRFYEAKVPMNRGCEIVDVARALLYVIEQQYETGQAIPVTGGQNMLK